MNVVLLVPTGVVADHGTGFSLWLIAAACILVVYGALWLLYIAIRYDSSQWLMRIFDAESYPDAPWSVAIGDAIRSRLDASAARPRILKSPTRRYRLARQLGSGDLCDVHLATDDDAFVLKMPRQTGFDSLLEKEQMILRQLQSQSQSDIYGAYFPVPREMFWSRNRKVSAFDYRDGFHTAGEIRRRYPSGVADRHLAWMFNRMLEALGFVHELGWVHGAIVPPHLLFHQNSHGMQLVGWTHAVPAGQPLQIVSKRFKAWYPSSCHRRERATPAVDIHLAAKSILWLSGADPLSDRMPDGLPPRIGQFLFDCLSPSGRHPMDAWALHAQFRELLEAQFGPPEFCHLQMN